MSFKRLFQRSNNEQTSSSLKHSQSVPHGLYSRRKTREPEVDPFKPVYRGQTPLKTSDIMYIEEAPGILDLHHAEKYMDIPSARANSDMHGDLLDKFPDPPGPPPRPARNPLRTASLSSHSNMPQVATPTYTRREQTMHPSNSGTSFSRPTVSAYPSISRKLRREATADQAMESILKTDPDKAPILGSSRQAERVRAKSQTGPNSYSPTPPIPTAPVPRPERVRAKSQTGPSYSPAPPIPTAPVPVPMILRPVRSRANLRRVPSQIAIPVAAAPDHGQSYWPHANYRDFLKEHDPHVIRAMINRFPVAPLYDAGLPEHLRPLRFNMNDPQHFQKTLSYWIHIAVARGRPLDAYAGSTYRRIIDAGDPSGIVPDVGHDWSQRREYR